MDDDRTIDMLERLGDAVASPAPGAGGLVLLGRAGRRRQRRRRVVAAVVAGAVVAIGATVLVASNGAREPGAAGEPLPGVAVVTDPTRVAGTWQLVKPSVDRAVLRVQRRLVLEQNPSFDDDQIVARWSDGVNDSGTTLTIAGDGGLTHGSTEITDVGCATSCPPPFSPILAATGLGLTAGGTLVLIGDDGAQLARYRPAQVGPPVGRADPDAHLVTKAADALGDWNVVTVHGGPPPEDAERGLSLLQSGGTPSDDLIVSVYDGLNTFNRLWRVTPTGTVLGDNRQSLGSTTVGCAPEGASCGSPAGFGVEQAQQLWLTPSGHLILVGPDQEELAVYEPAS